MKQARRSIVATWVLTLGLGAALLVGVVLHTVEEAEEREAQVQLELQRLIMGAETGLNRSLISIDLSLIGVAEWWRDRTQRHDRDALAALLRRQTHQNLMLRQLALVEAAGPLVGSSAEGVAADELAAAAAALAPAAMAAPVASLVVSPPAPSASTGETVLYFARRLDLPDGRQVVAVACVPESLLTAALQTGMELSTLSISIEREDGLLVAALPLNFELGRTLAPLPAAALDGVARPGAARLDGQPALVVARPTLHAGLRVVASLPLATLASAHKDDHSKDVLFVLPIVALLLAGSGVISLLLLRSGRARVELERSQRLMTSLVATTQEGYWYIDTECRTLDVNPAMCELLGRPRAQIVGRTIWDFVDEPNRRVFEREIAARREGKRSAYEVSLTRGDGRSVTCMNNATPVYDESGRRTGSIGLWTDVSVLKRSQLAYEHARATLDRALAAMADGLVLYDAQDRLELWNAQYESIYPHLKPVLRVGAPLVEIQAYAARHMLPHASDEERTAWIAGRAARHRGGGGAFELVLPDHRVIQIVERTTADGGFVGVFRDITALKASERELAQAKDRLEQALDAMSDGFVVFGSDERLVLWNRRYTEMLPYLAGRLEPGMAFDEVGAIAVAGMFPQEDDPRRAEYRALRLRQRRETNGVNELCLLDGRVVEVIDHRADDGSFVTVLRDVTRARRAADELGQARDAAEEGARAKSRFLAAMSHEIRTPLNAVLGMNGLLLDTRLDAEQRRYVELIARSGESLLSIINDILDFSRLESGKLTLEVVPFSVTDAVQDVVSMLLPRAQQKGIALEAALPQGRPLAVQGDPGRLRQVLFNLVGNAIKFTERGGVDIELRVHEAANDRLALAIAVRDTGIGISPAQREGLFSEFTQADTSTARRFGGSGLGLAISRELTELMGGSIQLVSQLGVGSTFTLQLELTRADPAQVETHFSRSEPAAIAAKGLRVLVAEDNSVNQVLIRGLLTRMGHYLDVVSDGVEALRQVQAAPYDLVLMDVQMPHMDGMDATRAIRTLGGAAGRLPIVAMTANVMHEDRAACEAAGMDGFVGKPIDRKQLQQAMQQAIARRENVAHTADEE